MRESVSAYCPACNAVVCVPTTLHRARAAAQEHARVSGHVLQLADSLSWTHIETIAGEPALPLWD